jgi:glycosyltransferase involved in cell wall biosynthesis
MTKRNRSDGAAVGIHQVLVVASPGDAITNMARGLQKLLQTVGPSEIYAQHIDATLVDDVLPLSEYRSRHSRNVLVFHASMGQPEVHEFLMTRREAVVLVYHNVTPAQYFEPFDPVFSTLLAEGRRELEALRPRVASALAASAYNARELEAIGYRDVRVVPPLIGNDRLFEVEPREATMHHLATFESPIMLSVGQVLPHKRPDILVEAMHIAESYLGFRSFLLLVGHQRLPGYARAIRDQVRELNVLGIHLVGAVDDADLAAMFTSASVVVTASEHEGFCLPLVEAMRFGKPVLARSCAAIPETVDGAGLLLPEDAGPALFAEAMDELVANEALQRELAARGHERVSALDAAAADSVIVDALLEVV